MELTKKTYCEVINVVGDSRVLTYHIQEEKWIPKPKEEENDCLESTDLESTPGNACLETTDFEGTHESPPEDSKKEIMIRVMYKVSFQKDESEFECSCHNFEVNYDTWKLTPKQKRYNELCNCFVVLVDAASSSDVKLADIKKWIHAQFEVSSFNDKSTCKWNGKVETTNSPQIESKKISNPLEAPKIGRPKENTPKPK
ncbi:hypothetical protein MKW98_004833, partial [Papaver atlanticum]